MDLETILENAGDLCDLNARQSPRARERLVRFANLGMADILTDAPYLFRSDEIRFTIPVEIKPLNGETIEISGGDAWLLKVTTPSIPAIAQWRTDGTHSTQAIFLTGTDGVPHRRIIQGVKNDGSSVVISITEPWINSTDTGLNWEVKTEDFFLPKDFVKVTAIRLSDFARTWHRPVTLIGEYDGRKFNNGLFQGEPWTAYPGGDIQIPQLTGISSVQLVKPGSWSVDTPGDKEYRITISWGQRTEFLPRPPTNVPGVAPRAKPLIESPPSEIISATTQLNFDTKILLPDLRLRRAMTKDEWRKAA